jgi:hypothetical protein
MAHKLQTALPFKNQRNRTFCIKREINAQEETLIYYPFGSLSPIIFFSLIFHDVNILGKKTYKPDTLINVINIATHYY